MRVIGIDLSLTGTGISDGAQTWVVGATGHRGDSLEQRRHRLLMLVTSIMTLVHPGPDLVLIEQPAFSKSTGSAHDRSGAWWFTVNSIIEMWGTSLVEVAPTSLKLYATGKGNAGKPQMLEAAVRRLPAVEHLGNDNRVDALWLAAMGLDHLGLPLCDLPVLHRKALDKVRWP